MNYQLQLEEKLQEQRKIKKEIKLLKELIVLNEETSVIEEIPKTTCILEYTHNDVQDMSRTDLMQIFRENIVTIEYVKQNSDLRIFKNASMNESYYERLVHKDSLYKKSKNNLNNDNVVFIIENTDLNEYNLKKLFIDKIISISVHS